MSHTNSDVVDKNKLTQRELLILLSENVERMNDVLNKLSSDYIDLHVRLSKVETKYKIILSIAVGINSIMITIILNFLNII